MLLRDTILGLLDEAMTFADGEVYNNLIRDTRGFVGGLSLLTDRFDPDFRTQREHLERVWGQIAEVEENTQDFRRLARRIERLMSEKAMEQVAFELYNNAVQANLSRASTMPHDWPHRSMKLVEWFRAGVSVSDAVGRIVNFPVWPYEPTED